MQADTASPLYRQLAEHVATLIASGALRRGDHLPSVREMAQQRGVAHSTVVRAYRELEDRRLVEARPRSGFVVAVQASKNPVKRQRPTLVPPDISQPPTDASAVDVSTLVERVMAAARDPHILSFGAACPDGDLFPTERPRKALSRALRQQHTALSRYPFSPGVAPLREVIARRALAWGCTLDPAHLVVTNGCLESISLCLQAVTQPGDVVALESPTYFGLLQILESLHLRALEIPTHPRTGMSIAALRLALDTQPVKAVLVVPTLSNPLGAVMPLAARRELAALAEAHGLPVIEDALYTDLCPRAEGRRAIKSFDRNGWVMLCSSYSKTVAPGLRLGWVEAGRWSAAVRRLKSTLSGGHTEVLEWAMADLLGQASHEASLRQLRSAVGRRIAQARELIAQSFPPGTRVTLPEGGFILWVELPAGVCAIELHHAALREHICVAPGPMFSTSRRFDHCIRLGLGRGWGPAEQQALRRVGELATQLLGWRREAA